MQKTEDIFQFECGVEREFWHVFQGQKPLKD